MIVSNNNQKVTQWVSFYTPRFVHFIVCTLMKIYFKKCPKNYKNKTKWKKELGELILFDFKSYSKAMLFKTPWYDGK